MTFRDGLDCFSGASISQLGLFDTAYKAPSPMYATLLRNARPACQCLRCRLLIFSPRHYTARCAVAASSRYRRRRRENIELAACSISMTIIFLEASAMMLRRGAFAMLKAARWAANESRSTRLERAEHA